MNKVFNEERRQILAKMLRQGKSHIEICEKLGMDSYTVNKEIREGSLNGTYYLNLKKNWQKG